MNNFDTIKAAIMEADTNVSHFVFECNAGATLYITANDTLPGYDDDPVMALEELLESTAEDYNPDDGFYMVDGVRVYLSYASEMDF